MPLVERLDIDPRFQGVWYLKATSFDGGKTFSEENGLCAFCRVFAAKVKFGFASDTGRVWKEMAVDQVFVSRDGQNRVMNIVSFIDAPVIWFITDISDILARGIMMDFLNLNDGFKEAGMVRAVCVVRV